MSDELFSADACYASSCRELISTLRTRLAEVEADRDRLRAVVEQLAAWRRCDEDPETTPDHCADRHDVLADIADAAVSALDAQEGE